jgi:prepilin-type N-terminal cleavage/methylation domain-containing protein
VTRRIAVERTSAGFTLAELLVAMALGLIVTGGIAALAAQTDRLARTQPRMMDAQQRARVVMDALGRDLRLAGAGLDRIPAMTAAGPLHHSFTPIWPRRVGRLRADGSQTTRPDAITLAYVPDTIAQAALAADYVPAAGRVVLSACALGAPCRLARGVTLAVFDPLGRVDLLAVNGGSDGVFDVRALGTSAGAFAAGAPAAEVVIRSYYFDEASAQVRFYDADGSDQPLVDEVTALTFEYFGDAAPPQRPQPPAGIANCLYTASGDLRPAATLSPSDDGLAPLPLALFADGPWCGAGGTMFDADLLRVRRVRVTARFRASGLRDPQPDYRVVLDVAPPNLGLKAETGGGQ